MSKCLKLSASPETLEEARMLIDEQSIRIDQFNHALYDGHAVFSQLTEREKKYTSPENVSAVLDAFKRAMKANTPDHPRRDT